MATIGSKFGGIPSGLPGWHFPAISLDAMRVLMGPAFTIAALGAIESLLSAMVADGMADTRHDPNQELIGQGIANILSPLVGGIAATGAIARTAANIRNGARTPVAGIVHSLVLLLVALVAAPLASYIPLATLSAILLAVAVRMAEAHTFVELWRGPRERLRGDGGGVRADGRVRSNDRRRRRDDHGRRPLPAADGICLAGRSW